MTHAITCIGSDGNCNCLEVRRAIGGSGYYRQLGLVRVSHDAIYANTETIRLGRNWRWVWQRIGAVKTNRRGDAGDSLESPERGLGKVMIKTGHR